VNGNRPSADPMALAMEWVSKITTVALEMVLPAIGGRYLDLRWGTQYWALVGLVIGFSLGIWHLLQMTKSTGSGRGNEKGGEGDGSGN
jgi:F0F1-type ATP synthase assembly protein I